MVERHVAHVKVRRLVDDGEDQIVPRFEAPQISAQRLRRRREQAGREVPRHVGVVQPADVLLGEVGLLEVTQVELFAREERASHARAVSGAR